LGILHEPILPQRNYIVVVALGMEVYTREVPMVTTVVWNAMLTIIPIDRIF
jgi:hypothetical protein